MTLKSDLEEASQKTDKELEEEFKRIRKEQREANEKLNRLALEEYVVKFEMHRRKIGPHEDSNKR